MEAAATAVHVTEVALACRADAAAMFLLAAAIGGDIAIVIIKIGLADRHPLVQVLEVDCAFVGLIVVGFHNVSSCDLPPRVGGGGNKKGLHPMDTDPASPKMSARN